MEPTNLADLVNLDDSALARWLALELLMTDAIALQDDVLQDRLIVLQDKIEAKMRAAVAWDSPAASAAGRRAAQLRRAGS